MAFFEKSLYTTISSGNVTDFEKFIKHGLSVNYVFTDSEILGKTLLEVAVESGQYSIVKFLVKLKCDPNLKMVANVENYSVKLEPYKKQNRLKLSCLYPCIVKADVDMIRHLVQRGLDVNIYDDRGCTPLWHAVDLDNYHMVKTLVSSPACDVNICDVTSLFPLHVAALHANVKTASLLVRKGARIDVLTVRGSTPLTLACRSNSYETARLLLLNGANPTHRGINGHTPISAVLESCPDRKILDMLIEAGACIDKADIEKCMKEKLHFVSSDPAVLEILRVLAHTPRSLKMQSCLAIRKYILAARSTLHIVDKVQQLRIPNCMKEFLLLNHL